MQTLGELRWGGLVWGVSFCLPLFFRGVSLCFEAFGAVVTSSFYRNISEAAGDDQGGRHNVSTQKISLLLSVSEFTANIM